MKTTLGRLLALSCVLGLAACASGTDVRPAAPARLGWAGETIDQWHGAKRHVFQFQGHTAWVVEPAQPLPGNPWTWCTEFPDAFTDRTGVPALVAKGFHHVHINDFNRLGCADQLALMDAFYGELRARGLAPRMALVGLSRGGFMAYRFAEAHPERVACIYADAPVCDMKSWPGGKGRGKGSPADWAHFKELYGFKDDAEACAFAGNALDPAPLARLAAAKVPLLHVVGEADDVVPPAENTDILAARYQAMGGSIAVIRRPGVGHHPHGLDNPKPVVEFICAHAARP